jgi:hypothetical protein
MMKMPSQLVSLLSISLCLLLLDGPVVKPARHCRLAPLPASARPHGSRLPRLRYTDSIALNWAGYVVANSLDKPTKHTVTDVKGSWQVPAVASSGFDDSASAVWVGIDGNTDNTVEQLGTEQDWSSGAPNYYAWFEMFPGPGFQILDFPVSPGDQISAEVQYLGKNKFNLMITNMTQNVGFSIVKKRSAKCTSAEWIVEAPYYHKLLRLADFGSVTFTGCSATVLDETGPVDDAAWQNEGLTMEPTPTVTTAVPSALTDGGTSFTVTWENP